MDKECREIKKEIIAIAKKFREEKEVCDYLAEKYEQISNLPGKGYEKKYDVMKIINAKNEYTKRFTVKNYFGGDEDIELVVLRSDEYKKYFVILCGFQGNRMTRIEIYNCGKRE